METVVRKWGNSLGIRIPGLIARKLSLQDGSFVEINNKKNEIIIKPVQKTSLAEMLNNITKANIHGEIETTGPAGKKNW